jgi:hypothetical protein
MPQGRAAAPPPEAETAQHERLELLGRRVAALSERLGLAPEAEIAALESVASQTPAGVEAPETSLSESDEAILRKAGGLQRPMPNLEDRASFRTQLLLQRLVETALTVKEAAARLGVTESRVRQRLGARTLLGVERGGIWRLPAFQFDTGGDLADVLPAFPDDVHPVAVQLFLDAPNAELDVDGAHLTPRSWLASGGAASRVVELIEDAYALP